MATSPTLQDGAELRRRRIEAGLKVTGLAAKTGLHQTYIRLLEREARSAQPDKLKLIADVLPDCTVRDLLKARPKTAARHKQPVAALWNR